MIFFANSPFNCYLHVRCSKDSHLVNCLIHLPLRVIGDSHSSTSAIFRIENVSLMLVLYKNGIGSH